MQSACIFITVMRHRPNRKPDRIRSRESHRVRAPSPLCVTLPYVCGTCFELFPRWTPRSARSRRTNNSNDNNSKAEEGNLSHVADTRHEYVTSHETMHETADSQSMEGGVTPLPHTAHRARARHPSRRSTATRFARRMDWGNTGTKATASSSTKQRLGSRRGRSRPRPPTATLAPTNVERRVRTPMPSVAFRMAQTAYTAWHTVQSTNTSTPAPRHIMYAMQLQGSQPPPYDSG